MAVARSGAASNRDDAVVAHWMKEYVT